MNKNETEYKKALNKIVISDELKEKIIQNSLEKQNSANKKIIIYKRFRKAAVIAACAVLCVLSYYAVTKYNLSDDAAVKTTALNTQMSDNPIDSEQKSGNTAAVSEEKSDTKENSNSQTNIKASKKEDSSKNENRKGIFRTENEGNSTKSRTANNSVSTDAKKTETKIGAERSSQPDSLNAENNFDNAEQNDFPSLTGTAPSVGALSATENAVGNPGGLCSEYTSENMSSIKDIERELGYEIKIPKYIPKDYKTESFSAPFGEFAQITYTNADETDTLYYRTAKGTENISGDYNNYSEIENVVINDNDVTIKGNDNLYNNASWTLEDETFSIYSNSGLEKDTMTDMVESVE